MSHQLDQLQMYYGFAQGQDEAFRFAIQCEGNSQSLRQQLESQKQVIETDPYKLQFYWGYLSGLCETLAIISASPKGEATYTPQIFSLLQLPAKLVSGRFIKEGVRGAFSFSIACEAVPSVIEQELQTKRNIIQEGIQKNAQSPYRPGTSVRVVLDAYLDALEGILAMIR